MYRESKILKRKKNGVTGLMDGYQEKMHKRLKGGKVLKDGKRERKGEGERKAEKEI